LGIGILESDYGAHCKSHEVLHGHVSGECYPEQVALAKKLADGMGEQPLRDYYLRLKLTAALKKAFERQEEI
jgi:hypothetical protein